uniref:Uncharacterized protein n=1 Tax=Setaria italica TaxID=4555 RepID=K4AI83_SETIT
FRRQNGLKWKDTVKQSIAICKLELITWGFKRNFGPQQLTKWHELLELLSRVHLTEDEDTVRWSIEKHGMFTFSSLYKQIKFSGVRDLCMLGMPISLKIRNF